MRAKRSIRRIDELDETRAGHLRLESPALVELHGAVTAVSGSGPAYVFRFIEAIEQAGIKLGLSQSDARKLTLATFRGAAELAARSSEPPSILRERVTSKGGTTAAALAVMEESRLGAWMEQALAAAARRGAELGDEFGR